jgi:hypothetical protein
VAASLVPTVLHGGGAEVAVLICLDWLGSLVDESRLWGPLNLSGTGPVWASGPCFAGFALETMFRHVTRLLAVETKTPFDTLLPGGSVSKTRDGVNLHRVS